MYKTLLVYVDAGARQESRLRAAARLAREHGAHLVGCAATGISVLDMSLLAGQVDAPLPAVDPEALREAGQGRLAGFPEQAARLGVASYEARLVEDSAGQALLGASRLADLVILSQDGNDRSGLPDQVPQLPELLALQGARPVLVVPGAYGDEALADTVVAGWDGGAPALRAIGAALPLLRRARAVKLAVINPDARAGLHGEEPGADMALYLARHGVAVEVLVERTAAGAGNALVGMALACHAGLLVCGAFGHGRLRERMLGGATRTLLAQAPVPLLIAH